MLKLGPKIEEKNFKKREKFLCVNNMGLKTCNFKIIPKTRYSKSNFFFLHTLLGEFFSMGNFSILKK